MIKKILISQPKPATEKSPYYDIAQRYGVEIVFRPFIKVEGLTPAEFRSQHISILEHSAVVFTSRHSIDHFFGLCKEMRVHIPESMKYFCLSEQIALYIQKYIPYRKRKVFFGETGKMEALVPHMAKHKNERYLIPLSDVHNDSIANLLDDAGIAHTEAVMYRTVSNDFKEGEPFDYDMLVFFLLSQRHPVAHEELPQFRAGRHRHRHLRPHDSQECHRRRLPFGPSGTHCRSSQHVLRS